MHQTCTRVSCQALSNNAEWLWRETAAGYWLVSLDVIHKQTQIDVLYDQKGTHSLVFVPPTTRPPRGIAADPDNSPLSYMDYSAKFGRSSSNRVWIRDRWKNWPQGLAPWVSGVVDPVPLTWMSYQAKFGCSKSGMSIRWIRVKKISPPHGPIPLGRVLKMICTRPIAYWSWKCHPNLSLNFLSYLAHKQTNTGMRSTALPTPLSKAKITTVA